MLGWVKLSVQTDASDRPVGKSSCCVLAPEYPYYVTAEIV